MNLTKTKFSIVLLLATLLSNSESYGQYTQTNTGTFAAQGAAPNLIEKSATAAPNDLSSFTTAVQGAFSTNYGGVFDFPTVPSGNTIFRGMYGAGYSKQVELTTSATMTIVQASSSLTPISSPYAVTTAADTSAYNVAIGRPTDVGTGQVLPNEVVTQIGFAVLARNAANGYPLDVQVTVSFSDGSTQAVISNIDAPKASDDTFFGFTAPEGLYITNLNFQSFSTGTTTPKATRIGFDDFGFITKESAPPPPPVIYDVNPLNYALINAAEGVHFQVQSFVNIDPTNIFLVLNSADVSSQLMVTGTAKNRAVSFSGLLAGQEYTMEISVTNSTGSMSVTQTFYTFTNSFPLFDSEGFADGTLYPIGPLQPVTQGRGTWAPNALEPAEIVDAGGANGKVLQRLGTGASRADFLGYPPLSSGTLVIEFDAFVSTTSGRTMDVDIQPINSGTMGSFLAWGEVPGKLAYFDNVSWIPIADLPTDWHHIKIVNFLSGPAAGFYDVLLNGVAVAEKLRWRNAAVGSAFGQFRIQTANTAPLFANGEIDNLVISAAPEDPNAFPPPQIVNFNLLTSGIINAADGLHFDVVSGLAVASSNITAILDGTDISASLMLTGPATNRSVAYSPLSKGNHMIEITAISSAGTTVLPVSFIATDEPWLIHPADGWASGWQWTSGNAELSTTSPIDGSGPYLRLNTTGGARNFMRQYQSGAVDINKPHFIRWKFRLNDPDFDTSFSVFNDRVHFFAHPVSRITASTTGGNSWAIIGAGSDNNGAVAGKTFWIFDNVEGNGTFNAANHVNSEIPIRPDHVYSFEVLVNPANKSYTVAIMDETSSVSFTSSAPHKFRDLTDATHTFLHFGIQASSTDLVRSFDLDSVSVTQGTMGVTLLNPSRTASSFSFSFLSQNGASHVVEYKLDLGAVGWTLLETIPGDGTLKTVTHMNPPGDTVYYRINSQ